MMGTSHAISGAATWVALTATIPAATGLYPLDAAAVTSGAIICAGAALLPDADHPNATIAHSVPGVGSAVAGAIGAASGGHRHGMHSLLAVIVAAVTAWFLGTLTWLPHEGWPEVNVGGLIAGIALTTFAAKVLKLARTWPRAWLTGIIAGVALVWLMPESSLWLPLCVTLGYVTHLAGDTLTVGGVPWLWPIPTKPPKAIAGAPVLGRIWQKNGYFALPILGLTGSAAEGLLAMLMTAYVAVVLGWQWIDETPALAALLAG